MFDIGFFELLLIGIVGLLVLGPERLPRAARTAGLWMRRARATWYSVRNELERELAEADLKKSLQQEANELDRLGQSIASDAKALERSVQEPVSANGTDSAVDQPVTSDDASADDERAMREPLQAEAEREEAGPGKATAPPAVQDAQEVGHK
ncbi:Sec-independent protein translocase protein TatB [Pseudomarimonas arenosa]|uniref:Sec-independent protein translocase protein TatB n=1 Tax=Pseudomarimonas arenosa TaxID=2774145 RepID=A0AAW3ZPU1_9GAMM|nr:Sec-independent protein translocase protein TatB [Pseudomarimonas arenosa]MBD8526627.1 twin-arginine translocase subunit TatB [Pseudomarimonas arenosa]